MGRMTIARLVEVNEDRTVLESAVDASEIGADPTVKTLGAPTVTTLTPRPADEVVIFLSVQGVYPELRPVTRPMDAVNTSTPASPPGPVMVPRTAARSRRLYPFDQRFLIRVTWDAQMVPYRVLSLAACLVGDRMEWVPVVKGDEGDELWLLY